VAAHECFIISDNTHYNKWEALKPKGDTVSRATPVDPEEFIRVWQTSESVVQVADVMGMSKLGASVKASHLRKAGVPLKKFRTGMGSDPQEFVEVWNSAGTLEEAAQLLGVQKTSASMRASHLRKLGLPIKKFPRGRRFRDIEALASFARSFEPPAATESRTGKLTP
jgi:hypothetical protein